MSPLPVLLHSMAPSFRLGVLRHECELGHSPQGVGGPRRHCFWGAMRRCVLGRRSRWIEMRDGRWRSHDGLAPPKTFVQSKRDSEFHWIQLEACAIGLGSKWGNIAKTYSIEAWLSPSAVCHSPQIMWVLQPHPWTQAVATRLGSWPITVSRFSNDLVDCQRIKSNLSSLMIIRWCYHWSLIIDHL